MYVICDKCEDVCAIFECKKVWSNDHRERYPRYTCDKCRNIQEKESTQNNEKVCAI